MPSDLPTQSSTAFTPSEAAQAASDHFNALPLEERAKLAPLLEHYRQMGLAEADHAVRHASHALQARIRNIRNADSGGSP